MSAPSSEGSRRDADRRHGGKGLGDRLNDYISNLDTPTKSREPRPVSNHKARPPKPQFAKATAAAADASSSLSDGNSNLSAVKQDSDLSSNITAKTLADISGDIPFGQSAFSELDLSVGGTGKSRPKRPAKVDRTSSLKTVPNVLKKVMEEGKKIMKDMNEPPRQTALNKPPSIETWLNTTVDPFVDAPAPVKKDKKKEAAKEAEPTVTAEDCEKPNVSAAAETESASKLQRRRAQTESSHRRPSRGDNSTTPTQTTTETAASAETEATAHAAAEDATQPTTPTSTGLKRTRAKRSSSSPLKAGKKEFLGMFKNAFQGESATFGGPPKSYQSQEHRKWDSHDDSLLDESVVNSAVTGSTETSTQVRDVPADPGAPQMAGPRFRPPTKGHHELSTILSDDGSSAASSNLTDSDLASRATQSTLTQ